MAGLWSKQTNDRSGPEEADHTEVGEVTGEAEATIVAAETATAEDEAAGEYAEAEEDNNRN